MTDGHRSSRSTGRVSCKSTELKRCSVIEMRWNYYYCWGTDWFRRECRWCRSDRCTYSCLQRGHTSRCSDTAHSRTRPTLQRQHSSYDTIRYDTMYEWNEMNEYIGCSDVTESTVTIRSPLSGYNTFFRKVCRLVSEDVVLHLVEANVCL